MTPAERWVEEVARTTRPERVVWCDGSAAERVRLVDGMLADGTLLRLHPSAAPGSTLHRSHPSDVARTEHLTFIASREKGAAGPTNIWIAPAEARSRIGPLFEGVMKEPDDVRPAHVTGPLGSPFSRVGIEVTDSPGGREHGDHMTAWAAARAQLRDGDDFVPASLRRRPVARAPPHRPLPPRTGSSGALGSGYGGNALLGKKCFALRIASTMARDEGWLAEHMLILELELPGGETHYVGAAFPSACGKTNLAMMVSPLERLGYKVRTVGDDIAWLRPGPDGRLWAVNPEAGFFGVVPGTGPETNPNAMATIGHDTIFTNVAVTPDGIPWWEGKDKTPPPGLLDWQGKPWNGKGKAAHPNSRFTVSARQCPSMSPRWEDPQGVPLSALVFGGRRARLAPPVFGSRDWEHGVFVGATMGSETTAAATGQVGVVRRDPMAMLPFCGYNMGDYFAHWLRLGRALPRPPRIFHVNWFRTGDDGRFLWPGFGENMRVLAWMIARVKGEAGAAETPIGLVPAPGALDVDGLGLSRADVDRLLKVDRDEWAEEYRRSGRSFSALAATACPRMGRALDTLSQRVAAARV
jgi:phosphoenolpyruvate carboxykinase (GTP)